MGKKGKDRSGPFLRYRRNDEAVTIPATISGKPVFSIGERAFSRVYAGSLCAVFPYYNYSSY
jgi:hypothetical protein